jgi:23S rRNA (guanosine2251-2'-O)-methyltransferase
LRQLTGQKLKNFLKEVRPPSIELVFVLQDVEDPVNVGAAFRIADGTGAREIVMTGSTPYPPNSTIAGVGRGTHRRIKWSYTKHSIDAIKLLKEQGFTSFALEIASESQPYYNVVYPAKVCIVVGNEHHGVPTSTLAACDSAIYIPMHGKIESLNVHVALAVVSYHIIATSQEA